MIDGTTHTDVRLQDVKRATCGIPLRQQYITLKSINGFIQRQQTKQPARQKILFTAWNDRYATYNTLGKQKRNYVKE